MESKDPPSEFFPTVVADADALEEDHDGIAILASLPNLPFTINPFKKIIEGIQTEQDRRRITANEIKTEVEEDVPWIDLLLDLSMTTAFNSLTAGTGISDGPSIASYVSFFALVWWIWASQVAYNVRFRQADIIHRVFVFCQLLVFAALAAFTYNFDITQIVPMTPSQSKFQSKSEFLATQHRQRGVSTANTRGISLVLALSRLLLLVQYAIMFYHARELKLKAIGLQIAALTVSMLCYFIAYGLLVETSEGREIAKLFLWYFPLVLEVASHYFASIKSLPGRVGYPGKIISDRSKTVFTIVLGAGLDQITGGLRILVGNGGIQTARWDLLTCSTLIFIAQFSLYFNSRPIKAPSSFRLLSWFFSHFFYLAALIVTLQGIAAQLKFGRLGEGFNQVTSALDPMREFILDNPGANLSTTDSDWPVAQSLCLTNGWALSDLIEEMNDGISEGVQTNNSIVGYNTWIQTYIDTLWGEMDTLEVTPSSGLLKQLYVFVYFDDPSNTTQINATTTAQITNAIWRDQTTSSTWFFAAAGSTLVTLAFVNVIGRWPKDKWHQVLWITKIVCGVTLISLTAVDVGSSPSEYNDADQYTPTLFWNVVDKFLILVIVAVIFVVEQAVEMVTIFFAGRYLRYLRRERRRERSRTHPKQKTPSRSKSLPTFQIEAFDLSTLHEGFRPNLRPQVSEGSMTTQVNTSVQRKFTDTHVEQ